MTDRLIDPDPRYARWSWRSIRNAAVSAELWAFDWHLGFDKREDVLGGCRSMNIGPLVLSFHYNSITGSFSAANIRAIKDSAHE